MTRRDTFLLTGIIAILAIVFVSHTVRRHKIEEQQTKEQTMRANLESIRVALKAYEAKNHHAPATLSDLVRDGELKSIPADPITGSSSTWKTSVEETVHTDDFSPTASAAATTRIIDVRSGAPGHDSSGRPWSEY